MGIRAIRGLFEEGEPVILEQLISRYAPLFDVANARLGLGQDGNVYLASTAPYPLGYVLRVAPDGTAPLPGVVGYAVTAIAANGTGIVATAEAHFSHRVSFWDDRFISIGQVDDFLDSDAAGWGAPSDVQAGPSGDFYAIDQYRLRVLRVDPTAGVVASYPLDRLGVSPGWVVGLRVSEERSRLYTAWDSGGVRVCGFDGSPLWSVPMSPAGFMHGGFDVAGDGRLYVLATGNDVHVVDVDGQPAGTVTLQAPAGAPPVTDLRVRGDEVYVKRTDPATLFEVYHRATGALVRRVAADVERLTVTCPAEVWTAGQQVPLTITLDSGAWPANPQFRVWLRPLGVPEFTELVRDGDAITVPRDARGLFHLRVCPDVRGRFAEYVVDGVVEVRSPASAGTVSILTPLNRFYYGHGEPVPVTVIARTAPGTPLPDSVSLRIRRGGEVVDTRDVTLTNGRGEVTFDGTFGPGRYAVDTEMPGFTVAPQYLEVGPGAAAGNRFHVVQHGDYLDGFPTNPRRPERNERPVFADLPELTADHLSRARKLGINLFVDRLAHGWQGRFMSYPADPATVARLTDDVTAVAPEKAMFEDPTRRAVAGYGAYGICEQAILLYMDAGLPLGLPYDTRTPEQMEADLEAVTGQLLPYPAFRGWSWAANWWLQKVGAAAARDAAERAAYEAALTAARDTGAWSPVLDTVSDRTLALKADAERRFRAALHSVAPGKVSAATAPYRAIQSYPPAIFQGADEVDLHYQSEQIQPPQVSGHHVDYYQRPGNPAWGHSELWNDDGTGGMLLPTLFQMAMRGAAGVGAVGDVAGSHAGSHAVAFPDARSGDTGPKPGDPRCGGAGKASVLRAAYDAIRRYGPLLATAEATDRVAIVVSGRMCRIETWDGRIGSSYFDSLFEAYNACLYAHRPASFVFAEDATAQSLARYRAVLVVGQRVELDPSLATALQAAIAAGVQVYADGGCRPELVTGCAPLSITFDRVRQDPSPWQDDAAYHRFRTYFLDHADALRKVLGQTVPPVARCDDPEVLLSERRAGDIRFVWAVNNTMLDWDPGLAWRVSLLLTHRLPIVTRLTLDVPAGHTVVDVFAGEALTHDDGTVTADLRNLPARLYAIVPNGAELPGSGAGLRYGFGPHVRDIAVAGNGRTAVLNCFNWDHNLYGLDLQNGRVRWRGRIGHFFAYAPTAHSQGFAALGFDLLSGEGHHVYLLDGSGTPRRRFALFGLPQRATDWAVAEWGYDTGLANFAVAPNSSWVASCGDLGLVLWDSAGAERWSRQWWAEHRQPMRLLALDDSTLVACHTTTVTAYATSDGTERWSLTVAGTGTIQGGMTSADGTTLVLWSDTLGGRLFVVRNGALVRTIPTAAEEVAISRDGRIVVVTAGRQLKTYNTDGGLLWTYTGDDLLRRPRISADGARIAVGTELGTLAVLTKDGAVVAEHDLGALPVPAWLPDGDLLAATWMGTVIRYRPNLTQRWQRTLTPTETDIRPKLRLPDPTPATRKTGWGNAAATPLPLAPNLLTETTALITAEAIGAGWQGALELRHPIELLRDGSPEPPPQPWLHWHDIGYVDSGWRDKLALEVDTFRTQVRATGVTFAEDPAHPESWLRDVRLQWWDAAAEKWRDGPMLLSDTPTHSHVLTQPIEAARFRFVSTGGGAWPAGNLRLGELVFHGQSLGASHPDVVAKRPLAVLFDEQETDLNSLKYPGRPFGFRYSGAYSGGKCLELSAAGETGPAWVPPFGHAIPNWDFHITEQPQPGEYRYLQFAWKALSTATTGITMLIGREWPGSGVAISVGDATWPDYTMLAEHRIAGTPPADWTTARLDLWAITNGNPPPIRCLMLRTVGGGALFDQLLLARSESDLPPPTG